MQSGFDRSRRALLIRGSLAASALLVRPAFGFDPATTQTPTRTAVRTRNGVLLGETENDVRVFRGVPFAEPPVGDLRFRRPQALKVWTGERDSRQFAPAAMQPQRGKFKQSEDCLYLNIWTPVAKGPHPVFVWIHGGGFTGGQSFAPIFDGSEFAREGIIVVTVAYRLGVFGFLDMGPLLGPSYAGSANNALRDLIAALQWVQDNIGSFGGDPKRVTVGGESAGAKLTDILMGVPEAGHLFQQMISESGGAERIWPRDGSVAVAKGFGELWTKERAETLPGLKQDPAESLIQVQEKFTATWPQHFPLRCEIDGQLLPRLPVETIARGSTKGKRLLIGTTRDESALFVGPHPRKDPAAGDLGNMSTAGFASVFGKYKAVYPQMTDEQLRIRALSAEEYWIPSLRVAEAHIQGGGAAWMYRLDFAPSSGHFEGQAYHSSDLGLVWDKPNKEIANAEAEARLAKQMHTAWATFIVEGSPATPELPEWPQFKRSDRSTMIFGTTNHIELNPQDAERRLWNGLL